MSLITTVDHNLPEPGSSSKKPTTNPDIAHFMTPNASEDDGIDARDIENVLAVASLFGGIRDRPYMEENETQQRLLDNLISQLLEEANASAKGPPPASKEFIQHLPTVDIAKDSDKTCSVCVERFNSVQSTAKRLPCQHMFHVECITPWLELHNTCPICRREFPTDDAEYERKRREKEREAQRAALQQEEEEEEWDPFYG